MYSVYRSKEDNQYYNMMGVYPERYKEVTDEEVKKIYDHRAMALLYYYRSKNDQNSVRILTKHHKNCAEHIAKTMRSQGKERE